MTGASGGIGSAVVPELLATGHKVLGLARSNASADALAAAGAEVQRGELADLESLRVAATQSDGVIHLAFSNDFTNLEEQTAPSAGRPSTGSTPHGCSDSCSTRASPAPSRTPSATRETRCEQSRRRSVESWAFQPRS